MVIEDLKSKCRIRIAAFSKPNQRLLKRPMSFRHANLITKYSDCDLQRLASYFAIAASPSNSRQLS